MGFESTTISSRLTCLIITNHVQNRRVYITQVPVLLRDRRINELSHVYVYIEGPMGDRFIANGSSEISFVVYKRAV